MRKSFSIAMLFLIVAMVVSVFATGLYAQEANARQATEGFHQELSGTNKTVMTFAAMGAVGLSCMMSAYALAKIGSAALGAMSEKHEIGGRALVFLGMAEGIAIYGLIIAIMILNKV